MLIEEHDAHVKSQGYVYKSVNKEYFRAYDIRGIVNDEFDIHTFFTIGKALAVRLTELNRKEVFVGCDVRLSSNDLKKALIEGLLQSGINVYDLGVVSTPILYYAAASTDIDSGFMITGSHNPKNYNGIKMVMAGETLKYSDIDLIYSKVQEKNFVKGRGKYQQYEIFDNYVDRITSDIKLSKPLKIVVDSGNGVAGPIADTIFKKLNLEVISIFSERDGNFPNHHPDPSVEANLSVLKQNVTLHNADLGIAFDGDADRIGIVTRDLKVIWPDRLMMLYVKDLLTKHPASTIVYDVKCSNNLTKLIEDCGGKARMCPTGHSIIKAQMKEDNAILAGEMSGHIFFKDRWYGFDDAVYAACRLLEILSNSELSVTEQLQQLPDSINTPEIQIPIADHKKFSFIQTFKDTALFPDAKKIIIDGLRVEFEDGWGLLRASNTSACLVARFEANNDKRLQEIQGQFKQQLKTIDENLQIPF